MAIAGYKPVKNPVINTTLPETIKAPNKTTMTALVPDVKVNSLLKYVEGYPWTVTWYGQILNENNTLQHFDPNAVNLVQSYYEVKDLVLQVNSPLSSSYDEETSVMSIRGSAIAPQGVKPNQGDLFIAKVDTGEEAIIVVNSVSRATHRKSTLYNIDYSVYAYISDRPEFHDKLLQRVNETYYFNKDTNFFNRDVLITPSVKNAMDVLRKFVGESQSFYFNSFIQPHTSSLLVPGTMESMYDPLLANFIARTVDTSKLLPVKYHRHTLDPKALLRPSILDSIITRTLPHPTIMETQYSFCSVNHLPRSTRLATLGFTGVDYVLYPTHPKQDFLVHGSSDGGSAFHSPISTRNYFNPNLHVNFTSNNDNVMEVKLLPELFVDDYYIVTKNFYDYLLDPSTTTGLSYIELMIFRFINRDAIPREDLVNAVISYKEWSLLHQYYLLPVLWVICREAIGG